MRFGGQTVTFVTVTLGDRGYLGVREATPTETAVTGCRFRPLSAEETEGITDVSTGIWKATIPPVDAAVNAQPSGEIKVDGVTYQIDGPVQPKRNMDGSLHHVTILCKKQDG